MIKIIDYDIIFDYISGKYYLRQQIERKNEHIRYYMRHNRA